jgi:ribosome-associated toxin RatA of RatAB toxin-antitoxin module
MKRISRSAIVEHKADEMYGLVDDIESYPGFLPWCAGATVHERTAQGVRATLTVGMRGLRHSFTTQNANRPGEAIDLRLLQGPFRRFAGAWRFKALSAHACSIEFTLEYELAGAMAKVLEPVFHSMADTMVDAFTRRADEVYGSHPG